MIASSRLPVTGLTLQVSSNTATVGSVIIRMSLRNSVFIYRTPELVWIKTRIRF
jgi:hypothetical protein